MVIMFAASLFDAFICTSEYYGVLLRYSTQRVQSVYPALNAFKVMYAFVAVSNVHNSEGIQQRTYAWSRCIEQL